MNIAYMITEDMLCSAARIDNLQDAIKDIMNWVDSDGTAGSITLARDQEESWPIIGYYARLAMLVYWRTIEQMRAPMELITDGVRYSQCRTSDEWPRRMLNANHAAVMLKSFP